MHYYADTVLPFKGTGATIVVMGLDSAFNSTFTCSVGDLIVVGSPINYAHVMNWVGVGADLIAQGESGIISGTTKVCGAIFKATATSVTIQAKDNGQTITRHMGAVIR